MVKLSDTYSVDDHFVNKDPAVRKLYDKLLAQLNKLGPIVQEPKKTSIHLVRTSALAGVQVRKDALLLNIKTDYPIESPRIQKSEKISASRFHHLVRLTSPADLDKELTKWLKDAYELSG